MMVCRHLRTTFVSQSLPCTLSAAPTFVCLSCYSVCLPQCPHSLLSAPTDMRQPRIGVWRSQRWMIKPPSQRSLTRSACRRAQKVRDGHVLLVAVHLGDRDTALPCDIEAPPLTDVVLWYDLAELCKKQGETDLERQCYEAVRTSNQQQRTLLFPINFMPTSSSSDCLYS